MSLSEKLKNVKTGLAVLVAGAMISGIAYAKEINNEGWTVPDDKEYSLLVEPEMEDFSCKYQGKTITVKVKTESYVNVAKNKVYEKYSFEGKTFMYLTLESEGNSYAFKVTALADRDGNGSMETKYVNDEIVDELEKEGLIPEWVIKKTVESQKTGTDQ